MAVINDANVATNIAQVGAVSTASSQYPLHVMQRPIPGFVGHYRTSIKLTMATSQNVNSRLFEIRNTGTNFLIPTRIRVGVLPAGTITGAYAVEIGLFRLTNFTAVDTTGTVTPTASMKRTGMGAYPGNSHVRHVTIAGAAGGMTGGTLTKDGNQIGTLIAWVATAAATTVPVYQELLDDVNGTHPLVFAQNEGFEIENVVAGSATANVLLVLIDVSWAEATAY